MSDFTFSIVLNNQPMTFNGRLTNAAMACVGDFPADFPDDGTNWVGGDLIDANGKLVSSLNLGTAAPGEKIKADSSEPAWQDLRSPDDFAMAFGFAGEVDGDADDATWDMQRDDGRYYVYDLAAVEAAIEKFADALRRAAEAAINK